MPSQIPRIAPEVQGVSLPPAPSVNPAGLAELSTRGMKAVAGALQTGAQQAESIYAEQRRINKAVQEERLKLETEQAMNLYDRAAADAIFQIKSDPNIQPEDYAGRVEAGLRKVKDSIGKQVTNPAVLPRFDLGVERKITTDVTKANYDGLERRLALNGAAVVFLNRDAENKAVFATTPEEREGHITGIMRRLDGQLVTGALTKDQYKAAVKESLTNIAMGDVLREVQGAVQEQNPEREQVVIDTLARGGHPNLAVDTQLRLAETLTHRRDARVREQDRLAEKNERALAKAAEAERELVTDGYDERAARGDLSHEELNQAVRDRVIRPDDARRIRKTIYDFQGDAAKASAAASVAGGKTDDAVYNRIELDILSRSRPVSRQEIRALQQNGKLAASGPRSAASLLKMVEDAALAAEGTGKDITKHPMFDQGLDDIKTLRMGKGIMSDLTDAEALRLRNAVREYHDIARSGKFTPSQLPEVARKIVDRALSERSPLERPALPATAAQQLRYRNPTDLAAAKKAGLIPDAEFNRQVDLMIEAGIIPKPGAPAPGAAPTPSTSEAARGGRR